MKVAVSSSGKDLHSQIDPRFGRCAFFVIVEIDGMHFEAFDNENLALSGGAGIQSAAFVASKGIKAVLTGNCGPKAMQALTAGEIEVFTGQTGTVEEAVEKYRKGKLPPTVEANVPEKFGTMRKGETTGSQMQGGGRGMGGGGGRGMGGGGGGMGGGGGRGMSGGGRGMGGGGGRGMGGGGGRGMGMGGGSGMGRNAAIPGGASEAAGELSKKEELEVLKKQSIDLKEKMKNIESEIKNME